MNRFKGNADYRDVGLEFPPDFQFGTATASYQIEGAARGGGRGPSIWDTFSRTPGKVWNGDTGDVAIDHYNRLDTDLDLLAELGVDTYRFSIAWPRIQPVGAGAINAEGIAFYDRLVDGLLERGIQPIATLYHWDLPQALEDQGGWVNRATAYRFADYAHIAGKALGDRVSMWTTLNEPWCAAYLGYGLGEHAPGRANDADALTAVHHLNLAHGLGIQQLRAVVTADASFSVTLNFHVARGDHDTSPEAIRRVDALANRAFTGPMLRGEYPEDLLDDTAGITDWDYVQDGDLSIIHQPLDILGINYYCTATVKMWDGTSLRQRHDGRIELPGTAWPSADNVDFLEQPGPYTSMGWNIAPDGLEELLLSLSEQFPDQPLMVTENGAAFDDFVQDGRVTDLERVDYLRRHFTAAHRALRQGVDLRGYQVWSMFDNFEWAYGYAKRFGIVHVDYESLVRIPKASYHWYRELIETRRIPEVPLHP